MKKLDGSLTPMKEDIITHLYLNGDDIPANVAENKNRSRPAVSAGLSELADEEGLVKTKGRGVWTLTRSGILFAQELMTSQTQQSSLDESLDEPQDPSTQD